MYLEHIYVENNGPLDRFNLQLPFTDEGLPKPVVLVGGNGSGKTNLLSIIADGLISSAGKYYTDVLSGMSAIQTPYFRVVGARTVRIGAAGSLTIMRFQHENTAFFFKEKAGNIPAKEAKTRLPETLQAAAIWKDDDNIKDINLPEKEAQTIFSKGVYVYFPSSRAEVPHWLNLDSLPEPEFNVKPQFQGTLRKPIFVEKGLLGFQQWVLSTIVDARSDFNLLLSAFNQKLDPRWVESAAQLASAYNLANTILRLILCDDNMRFAWLGRRHPDKLCIADSAGIRIPTLGGLSAGQSTLLGMFGTIIRYGDQSLSELHLQPNLITGLCVIDEIDAHMHIDLQFRALPALIKLFPKMQFVVSSHSPLFVLGMEKAFGADGLAIINMPSGSTIRAEAYAEFEHALKVLQATKAFSAAIEAAVSVTGKALIFLEGETDPLYFRTAAELLGRHALLEAAEFEWIGAKEPKRDQAFYTGKNALNQTLNFFRANPGLVKRKIVLLYDNDANKPEEDHDKLHVRIVPTNRANEIVQDGIENLLPPDLITDDMFRMHRTNKRQGGYNEDVTLDKMKLCKRICEERRERTDFEYFGTVLDMLEESIMPTDEPLPPDAPSSPSPK